MRAHGHNLAIPRWLLTTLASGAVAMVLTACAVPAPSSVAGTSSGLVRIHDPGHVTYSMHPAGCHAGPGPTPDHRCTPGAVDPYVTQDNLQSTICQPGYSTSARPPSSETNAAKNAQYRAYSIPQGTRSELDHLVPIEAGGANDISNLWPEVGPESGNPKDHIEDALHSAICSGKVKLADAQQAIADDWTTAEHRLGIG